jgi:beta-glucosidase
VSRRREIDSLKEREADLVILGDSISHFWEWKHPSSWAVLTNRYRTVNLGYGGDKVQNMIWRIKAGELDGYRAKCVVVMAGTNNNAADDCNPSETAQGVIELVLNVRKRQPKAKIILHPIFPRGNAPDSIHARTRRNNDKTNAILKKFAEERHDIVWVDFNNKLVNGIGWVPKEIMDDELHPTSKGYDIWKQALIPHIGE